MANGEQGAIPLEAPVAGVALPPGAAAPPDATEPVPAPDERATASNLTLTRDDIPELVDTQVGDVVSFEVSEVTDDGNFTLKYVMPEAQPETAPVEEAAGGREAVLDELTGGAPLG